MPITSYQAILPAFQALVADQELAVRLLEQSIHGAKVSHAYIFKGHLYFSLPLLYAFTQALLCPSRGCQKCVICKSIHQETYPDFSILRAPSESKSGIITREQIKELIRKTTLPPLQSPYQIFGIEGADNLNLEASNALLKTLEEPPSLSIIVLLATSGERLLPTIRSRAQLIPLRFLSDRLPDSTELLPLEDLQAVNNEVKRLELADRLASLPNQELLLQFQLWFRSYWEQNKLQARPEVFETLEIFERCLDELGSYGNPKLVIELFLVDYFRIPQINKN